MTGFALRRFVVGWPRAAALLVAFAVVLPMAARATPVAEVNATLLGLIHDGATPPPRASRAMAMIEQAMYDSVNAATGLRYEPFAYSGGKVGDASPDAVAYVAGYRMLAQLYPEQGALDATLAAKLDALNLDAPRRAASVALGAKVATDQFAARIDDGSATAQSPYVFGTDTSSFQSTANGAQPAVPSWGKVTPFVLASGDQFRAAPPPALGSAEWIAAYNEVKAIGCAGCGTPEQAETAVFWADDFGTISPPGRWLQIATDLAATQSLDLMATTRLTAMLSTAIADAGIASWDTKYTYDFFRPVTAIRTCTLATCGVEGDPLWTPLLPTPNFPSYGSGHSTFGGAAAAVFGAFFGSDTFNFCVTPYATLGLADRCYTSFTSASAENGQSRIEGGVHYQFDNRIAVAMGTEVGRYVVANAFQLAAVPEPATWALMIGGFGLVGIARRRQRGAISGSI